MLENERSRKYERVIVVSQCWALFSEEFDMRRFLGLIVVEFSFLMSVLMFMAGIVSLSRYAHADPSTSRAVFCGTPPAGSTDCPNLPACITGDCVIALKGCYCN